MLYGKAEGGDGKPFKLSAIANRINKNGWIRGTVVNGRDTYVIERTFSPQSLVVYKNGENLDKAGLRDMQGIIDAEILDHLPYHIFSNVMALSLNNFKSFISMSPNDKRQIIDKIFSLEILVFSLDTLVASAVSHAVLLLVTVSAIELAAFAA